MLKTTVQKTITGTSTIGTDVAASMNGTIHDSGKISIAMNVVNDKIYKENKTDVKADLDSFIAAVYAEEVEDEQNNDES